MAIREATRKDYDELAVLFNHFFPVHNIFQQEKQKITEYLGSREEELIVLDDGGIRAATYLVQKGEDTAGSHKIWKFRHFAYTDEESGARLLEAAEERIKSKSKTSKIELTISENEEGLDFYKKHGYKTEGTLTNHYRWGETCYILCRSFENS